MIRKIDKNIGTVPEWGEDNFDANVHENFSSLKEIVTQVNNSIDDINTTIDVINTVSKEINTIIAVLPEGSIKNTISDTTTWSSQKIVDTLSGLMPRVTSLPNRLVKFINTDGDVVNSNLYSNAEGDLGLNVTPSIWHTSVRALETQAGSLFNWLGIRLSLIQNAYHTAGDVVQYKTTGKATMITQENGEIKFYTAPNGTAGTTVTFTERFKINNIGVLTAVTPALSSNNNELATTQFVKACLSPSPTIGAINTYALLSSSTPGGEIQAGAAYAGSGLRYSGFLTHNNQDLVYGTYEGPSVSGTWRAFGQVDSGANTYGCTLFVRII